MDNFWISWLPRMLDERCTVFSPINGHSKRRTHLISGQFFFHRPNCGQSLIKNFLKGGQVISGHFNKRTLLSARSSKFGLFSLQLADSPKFLETGIKKMTKLNGFLSIYFKQLETLYVSSFFTASVFLINQFTSFSWS